MRDLGSGEKEQPALAIRFGWGATPYDTTTEQVVDTLPPGTLALSTNEGLGSPGPSMGFKVYVELTTGNEKGSNTVTINRP